MPKQNLIFDGDYNGYKLMTNDSFPPVHRKNVLDRILERLVHMTSEHPKVLSWRLVVRFPQGYPPPEEPNLLFSVFMEDFIEALRSNWPVHFVWVREQNASDFPHYHLLIMAATNWCQAIFISLHHASETWAKVLGIQPVKGLIHICQTTSGNDPTSPWNSRIEPDTEALQRGDELFPARFRSAVWSASYLAKDYSKGLAPSRVRELGASYLPVVPVNTHADVFLEAGES